MTSWKAPRRQATTVGAQPGFGSLHFPHARMGNVGDAAGSNFGHWWRTHMSTPLNHLRTSVLVLLSTLSGCATLNECGFSGCPADAAISAAVAAQFDRYAPLTANSVRIQTLHNVVYLTGVVDTDVERSLADSVAGGVPGVARVVDSISINNVGR